MKTKSSRGVCKLSIHTPKRDALSSLFIVEFRSIAFRGNFSLSTTFPVFRIPDSVSGFQILGKPLEKKVLPWKSKFYHEKVSFAVEK